MSFVFKFPLAFILRKTDIPNIILCSPDYHIHNNKKVNPQKETYRRSSPITDPNQRVRRLRLTPRLIIRWFPPQPLFPRKNKTANLASSVFFRAVRCGSGQSRRRLALLCAPAWRSTLQPRINSRLFSVTRNDMVAEKIDGTAVAKKIRERIGQEIKKKQETSPRFKPSLTIVQGESHTSAIGIADLSFELY